MAAITDVDVLHTALKDAEDELCALGHTLVHEGWDTGTIALTLDVIRIALYGSDGADNGGVRFGAGTAGSNQGRGSQVPKGSRPVRTHSSSLRVGSSTSSASQRQAGEVGGGGLAHGDWCRAIPGIRTVRSRKTKMFLSAPNAVVPSAYGNGPTVVLPMKLLLHLHNCAPQGHEVRQCIKDYILAFGDRNEKAHWSRGIVVLENGDLHFDERLYDVALYRGKQETYIKSAEEAFEKLQSALQFVTTFQQDEFASAKVLETANIDGTHLVPIRDLSESAKKLQAKSEEKEGMTESLTQPGFRQIENGDGS